MSKVTDLKGALGLVKIWNHGHILVYPSTNRGYVCITQRGHKDRNGKLMKPGTVGPSDGFFGMGAKAFEPKTFRHPLVGPGDLDEKNKHLFDLYGGRTASVEEQHAFAQRRL